MIIFVAKQITKSKLRITVLFHQHEIVSFLLVNWILEVIGCGYQWSWSSEGGGGLRPSWILKFYIFLLTF